MAKKRRLGEGVNIFLSTFLPLSPFPHSLSPFSHFSILSPFSFHFLVCSPFPLHFLILSPFSLPSFPQLGQPCCKWKDFTKWLNAVNRPNYFRFRFTLFPWQLENMLKTRALAASTPDLEKFVDQVGEEIKTQACFFLFRLLQRQMPATRIQVFNAVFWTWSVCLCVVKGIFQLRSY